ncbi:hypothetical protein CCACVL1_17148 [Corchorus capsularis]|uniref:Carbohydrate kinase PfkB domain-containing protein n=1 Tax=Corchorus capsularis TaxID=210143 RepID=A0A1R3HTY7_COCAP|nr:hypothetical protein CCACVL1_17148 [Corchorus capsularis]
MERRRKDGEAEPVVIGGMVLDIQATSSIPPHPRTTCPGKVHYVRGGVARNIAECMWKLGADPFMISALGFDMAGNLLLEHWKSAKLPTEGIRKHEDIKTPTVCHILDVTGEVAAGVASVEAVEMFLTPEWIQKFKHKIHSAPILMVDANLSPPALEASCQIAAESDIPVWFEPVSVAKSKRIVPVVKYITFASPNEDELIAMANALSSDNMFHPIEKNKYSTDALFQKLKPAIWLLLEKGVKILVLTIGSDGVILCSKGEPSSWRIVPEKAKKHGFSGQLFEDVTSRCPSNQFPNAKILERSHFWAVHFPALPASVVRLTGAGDCLVGGMLASLCAGLDVMQSVAIGIAAAKASVEADSNVPSQFSLATIAGDARTVYSAARILSHQSKLQWALPYGLNFAKSPKCIVLMRYLKDSLVFHVQALKAGFTQSIITYNKLIHLHSKQGLIHEAQKLFDEMPERNVFTWNTIISSYIKSQNLTQARALFDAAPKKDLVTYNSMLSGYVSADGYETHALELFNDMQTARDDDNIKIDEFTVTTMLNLSAKLSKLSYGTQLHCFMVKTGNAETGFAVSSLIDMYSKCGCFKQAFRVFKDGGELVDLVSKNAMVAAFCREGEMEMALELFWKEPELNDAVSWNTLISGFQQHGFVEESLKLFVTMGQNGIRWNEHTFTSVLSACSILKNLNAGKEVHAWVLKNGLISNPYVSSGIVDVYCKCGKMKYAEFMHQGSGRSNSFSVTSMIVGYSSQYNMVEARKLFDLLAEKNSVVWTALFSGYLKSQNCDAVFQLLGEFWDNEATIPDALILMNVLGACALQAALDQGKQTHGYMLRVGIEMDEKLFSAIIDMYSKCGNISYAEKMFRKANVKDSVIYNVTMAGYAHHGHESKVFQLFEEMLEQGIKPDVVTFIALLSACRHCGLVELGEKYFNSMTESYKILPESDHYTCMIDLYGRANQLEKAVAFMKVIPVKKDAAIMGAFLNACRLNKNAELAREAEEKLLEIEGDNGARYVQLANIYAAEGNWEEMGRIRKEMRGKVKKFAGCSWVFVDNEVNTFISSDRSHSKAEAIYAILGCLTRKLHETGEVGLRLLFSPISSNIVVRTACCTVGTVIPVYSTFKAIENKDQDEQQKWLLYWTVYGSFSVAEVFADKILSWFPLYYHAKFAFLVWLQLPSANGAKQLYASHLRPFLLRHQARLDQILEFIYSQLVTICCFDVPLAGYEFLVVERSDRLVELQSKFISAHRAEIRFARALFVKLMASVNQIARNLIDPVQRQPNHAIEGSREVDSDALSDCED